MLTSVTLEIKTVDVRLSALKSEMPPELSSNTNSLPETD